MAKRLSRRAIREPSGPAPRLGAVVRFTPQATRTGIKQLEGSGFRVASSKDFRSAAAVYSGQVLAVVLTGMGSDGAKGAAVLKRTGAHVIVQDEASSVVWGMPGFVARAALADSVVSIHEMARDIMGRVALRRAPVQLAGSAGHARYTPAKARSAASM